MDTYDNVQPTGTPVDSVYLLEVQDKEEVFAKRLWGVYECLEAAMHALHYASMFCVRRLEYLDAKVLVVSRTKRNVINMQRLTIISWHLDEGESQTGVRNSHFELHHRGLRTHAVERCEADQTS